MLPRPIGALRPGLPRPVWTLIAGATLSALGNGLVAPFLAIYLHSVRGVPIVVVGSILAVEAVGGLGVTLAGGGLTDRFGARRISILGLGLQAAGAAVFAASVNIPLAVLGAFLVGAGNGLFYPGTFTLLARLTTPAQRTAAASLRYAGINLGMGLGAVIAGLLVSVSQPLTFVGIFLADAASFLGFLVLLALWVPEGARAVAGPSPSEPPPDAGRGGYRAVWAHRTFRLVLLIQALMVMGGYAQLSGAIPLDAKAILGISTRAIGLAFAANTVLIVIAQLPLAGLIPGHRRSRVLAASALVWTLAFAIGAGAAALRPHGLAAALALGAVYVTFGVGECLLSASLAPLAMDLAPERGRGRYMAALSLPWGAGMLVGPALGTLIIGSPARALFWPLLLANALLVAAMSWRLGRRLPGAVDRAPRRRARSALPVAGVE